MGAHSLIKKRILVVTAVEAEKEAVLRGLSGDDRFEVLAAGVGPAAAAACTAAALVRQSYALAVSAGIGGGFPGTAEVGSLVVAESIIAADLGVETAEGFKSMEELGFGGSRIEPDRILSAKLAGAIGASGQSVHVGPVLTVSTATGSSATAAELVARYPLAAAEGMEGYGVAAAADGLGVPCMELRGISNAVGPRDRAAWRIADALAALEKAFHHLSEVLK